MFLTPTHLALMDQITRQLDNIENQIGYYPINRYVNKIAENNDDMKEIINGSLLNDIMHKTPKLTEEEIEKLMDLEVY